MFLKFGRRCVPDTNLIAVTCILVLVCFRICFSNDEGKLKRSCGKVVVQRSENKPGFHRDLVTYVEWDIISSDHSDLQDCQLLLVEYFPSGVYVDPDQVKNEEEFGGPEVLSTEVINVESLAHHSSAHKVFLFPKTVINSRLGSISANISMPIHLRYHQAVQDAKFISVSLSSPTVLGRCNGINDLVTQCGNELIKAPCNAKIPSRACDWTILTPASKDQPLSSTPLVFHVPVGQIEHSWPIITLTVLSTTAGCSLILWNSLAVV